MVIERISVKTLRQEVYDQLRDKIISAEILPGEAVSLRGLAEKFGVSLMPVREALWQLESERIIVIESNKRIRVNTLTAKEMEEALRLRLLLESTAAETSLRSQAGGGHPESPGYPGGDGVPRWIARRSTCAGTPSFISPSTRTPTRPCSWRY